MCDPLGGKEDFALVVQSANGGIHLTLGLSWYVSKRVFHSIIAACVICLVHG